MRSRSFSLLCLRRGRLFSLAASVSCHRTHWRRPCWWIQPPAWRVSMNLRCGEMRGNLMWLSGRIRMFFKLILWTLQMATPAPSSTPIRLGPLSTPSVTSVRRRSSVLSCTSRGAAGRRIPMLAKKCPQVAARARVTSRLH